MTLDHARVERVIASIRARVPDAEHRLVGTASSVLRGIDLPAHDIDILFARRADVDAWFSALSSTATELRAPEWLADSAQYFTRLTIDATTVELSTVEIAETSDTKECIGPGPWQHFDLVPCGAFTVPAVATELRLVTEISRGRTDRARPIVEHLRDRGCDRLLVHRGLSLAGIPTADIERVLVAIGRPV